MQADELRPQTSRRFRFDPRVLGPLLALIVLGVVGYLVNPVFISPNNILNVLTRSSFIGIIAIGATFVIIAGGIDLSVGSMAAFIAGVMILFMNSLVGMFGTGVVTVILGIVASLLLGVVAGFINGLTITKAKIAAFIVTLGTLGIFRSLITYIASGGNINLNFDLLNTYSPIYYNNFLGIRIPIWIFIVMTILGSVVLHRTRFGRYCYAIGSNEKVARYSAISVDWIQTLTYVLQGFCVAIATIIYVPQLGSANAGTGLLWELEAIAAVIIGGTALKGGSGHVWGTVVGAIILSMIGNILNLTNVISEYLNGTIQGLIIILAVFLQRGGSRDE